MGGGLMRVISNAKTLHFKQRKFVLSYSGQGTHVFSLKTNKAQTVEERKPELTFHCSLAIIITSFVRVILRG